MTHRWSDSPWMNEPPEAQDEDEHRHARRHRRRVDEQALEDDLDVHQPVADDGRGEGERDEAERHRRELHRDRRIDAEGERHGIAERERQGAKRRPPDNPPQLAPRRHRARPPQRPDETASPAARKTASTATRAGRAAPPAGRVVGLQRRPNDGNDARGAEDGGRQVDRRQPAGQRRRVALMVGPLGKHQREVQEQGRQHEQGDDVGPVERPVDLVEPAAERERQHAEERDRQPEEVQGRLVERSPDADRRAHQQREEADRGQEVVE